MVLISRHEFGNIKAFLSNNIEVTHPLGTITNKMVWFSRIGIKFENAAMNVQLLTIKLPKFLISTIVQTMSETTVTNFFVFGSKVVLNCSGIGNST